MNGALRAASLLLCAGLALAGARPAAAAPDADSAAAAAAAPARAPAAGPLAPGPGHWFYEGLPYGSDALVHPLRLILDGGFGILQFDDRSNRLEDVDFRGGWRRVWLDMGNPGSAIRATGGWGDFFRREVLPISANRKDAQYWPNYTLHLVGGGMSYALMREWFERHGASHPRWMAGATMAVYHVLNETVENDHRPGPTTDAIADLYIFDPLAIVLFSHEGVDGFFARRLHMRDWSTQPAFDPRTGAIENQGQNFSIKLALPRTARWSAFYHFGNHGEAGLSYTRPNGSAFSLGGGLRAKGLEKVGKGVETADLVPSYGFFYDRNGSLLFSVQSAKTSRYSLRINAYPGLIGFRGHTAGLFLLWNENGGALIAGIHLRWLPLGAAGRI
jgi:hypothetical protein